MSRTLSIHYAEAGFRDLSGVLGRDFSVPGAYFTSDAHAAYHPCHYHPDYPGAEGRALSAAPAARFGAARCSSRIGSLFNTALPVRLALP